MTARIPPGDCAPSRTGDATLPPLPRGPAELRAHLAGVYGADEELVHARARTFLALLETASASLGESAGVLLVRSPGGVNVLGRLVDHQAATATS
jgi:hypothetical protein